MIRIAARLREQLIAPIIEAGFLNYNQPTLAAAVQKSKTEGATEVIVQPYFLIDGQYASQDLPALVHEIAVAEPAIRFTIAQTLGDHTGLVQLTEKRIRAVDPVPETRSALLFVAHGTPLEPANAPIERVARTVGTRLGYGTIEVAYLDCNQPTIPAAIDQLVDANQRRIVILPYFLHLGRHVRTDLPAYFDAARARHAHVELIVTHHLDYDPLLVDVVAERVRRAY
jgi:sirohydrochlorin cobaltochelatase